MNNQHKSKAEHLMAINQKFEELDMVVNDYLIFTRNRGGTLGFCVGSHLQIIRKTKEGLNNMCGKFTPYNI